ncbi:MAG: phosphate ABC transporter, permease protein PstA [Flavobacteriales bacterium CG03_land_8_20_14_0_80_35_15]|nr:phosphate ABC transporter permease PstA [Zetaproteobacteria bacterium]NDK17723.1 phosphate ABC transporter permease PstA [Flavobacteriales bacterium]OIO11771.1 MAG: phosphate ABC transporter, permease protein PstA [Flavobacteriaceae bacterium CG1_02_35_72]PIV16470.1 MAG: phosphate ABC transporter, permease protein PstA [Flavobacteriales bacterium CG03_land_8_20_14_0_80_35_15]PIX06980.1 MAG: phosphate ABC transporter, permease protein PstA [Flavobacteriales bacterium CG_4_8_14_3_um_filter_35_
MNSIQKNRLKDQLFKFWGIACTLAGLVLLVIFIGGILVDGLSRIDWAFITDLPSRKAEKSGIWTPLMGSVWVLILTALISFPISVAAGVYLEEYAKKNRLSALLEINISNLAGVPSIIYGLLGLEVFVRIMHLGASVLAGALTLSLLILPIIIVATREAIKAVPNSIREASYALGASKWQTIWNQVLPASSGGILTGVILALSRAIGETAPLIVVGALAYVPFAPKGPLDQFSVLPIQIFNWISRPQQGFIDNAAAAIIILLFITFIMNGIAVYFRNKWQKKLQ